jgi:chemotaxis protein CheD
MTSVRMGEIAVATDGEDLVALGLGSCIGLVLIDRAGGVAGLAHIVLPESRDAEAPRGKFANLAVPELVSRMSQVGSPPSRLEAVIAGGARMFELGSEMDIGARNEAAVRDALAKLRVTVSAAATGGHRGRTVRVTAGRRAVTVREAGGATVTLLEGAAGEHPASGRMAAEAGR